jgi:hypothetical protein
VSSQGVPAGCPARVFSQGVLGAQEGILIQGNTNMALQIPEAVKNHKIKVYVSSSSEFTTNVLLKMFF